MQLTQGPVADSYERGHEHLPSDFVMQETMYEGVSKTFRTGRLERKLQMVQLSATRCGCIAIL
jgi:hypothetical protein